MGKVIEIGISKNKGNKIENVNQIEAVKGKGLLNDRKFKENNKKNRQVTLVEIENSPFLDMCKYIQKNSDLKIDEIPKDEMYAGDAYGFRVSKKT